MPTIAKDHATELFRQGPTVDNTYFEDILKADPDLMEYADKKLRPRHPNHKFGDIMRGIIRELLHNSLRAIDECGIDTRRADVWRKIGDKLQTLKDTRDETLLSPGVPGELNKETKKAINYLVGCVSELAANITDRDSKSCEDLTKENKRSSDKFFSEPECTPEIKDAYIVAAKRQYNQAVKLFAPLIVAARPRKLPPPVAPKPRKLPPPVAPKPREHVKSIYWKRVLAACNGDEECALAILNDPSFS